MQGNLFDIFIDLVSKAESSIELLKSHGIDSSAMASVSVCSDGYMRITISQSGEDYVVRKNEDGQYYLTHNDLPILREVKR